MLHLTRFLLLLSVVLAPAWASELSVLIERIESLERQQAKSSDLTFHGLLQFDGAVYSTPDKQTELKDSVSLRRLRSEVRGKISENTNFRTQLQFANDRVSVLNAYVDFHTRFGTFLVGNSKRPQSQDGLRSNTSIGFLERSLSSVALEGGVRSLGVSSFHQLHDRLHLMLGVHSNPLNRARAADEHSELFTGARLTAAPVKTDHGVLTLTSFATKSTSQSSYRRSTELSTTVSKASLLNTDVITDARKSSSLGAELAGFVGKFRGVIQWQQEKILDRAAPGNTFTGTIFEAGWMLSDDRRAFDSKLGTFGIVRPRSSRGALELVARYSALDLNDGLIQGGKGDATALALNWFVTNRLLIITEAQTARARERANTPDERIHVGQARLQVSF
jgi:phosphate-selective porin OprO and OprP